MATTKKSFNKKYYFGGVYEDYDKFMNYKKIAHGLLRQYKFQSFLDIGCGCGNLAKEMKKILEQKYKKKCDVYGIDFSAFAVKNAQSPFIKCVDCTKKLPFKNKQFDLVYIYTTYAYLKTIEDIKKAMKEAYRVAKNTIVFDDVFSHKMAMDKDNYDPFRLRFLNKGQWLKLWQTVMKKSDKYRFTKHKIIINKG